ncbi:NAD(+)/NADH kinase [Alicyclobacillus sp. SO9]|uniref:NAD(+)/NADH kinase n=1 Tax=Alicyclobacillus sp. SO9 TaxID=2665646 RepID=UPI0018E76BD4|nr:NAD(+)/NADH kinase [Alicyclobacillus sp. SO9]QQE76963.1 NAD(+)/NADH kinase [Alicyclobacillus sp. SO9]
MRTFALLVNLEKPRALELRERLTTLLHGADIKTVHFESHEALAAGQDRLQGVEMAFVLGGDGTLLGVARQLAEYGIPLLGINAGHLGFLSEAEPADLEDAVGRIIDRQYRLEKRVMLESVVHRDGVEVDRLRGLNDTGIAKGSFGRMVTVEVYIDDVLLEEYSGDGVIISTPTGSTAYSLSCGGPIVTPHLQVMLVTPICPHTLMARPCVIDANQSVRMVVRATHDDLGLTVDGQVGVRLQSGDEVTVSKSSVETTLVKLGDRDFFSVLRTKLHGRDTYHHI